MTRFRSWLATGTYLRLYVPVVLIIIAVTTVRYHYLLRSEREEAVQRSSAELGRIGQFLMPALVAQHARHPDGAQQALQAAATQFPATLAELRWQVDRDAVLGVQLPRQEQRAPGWFQALLDLPAAQQQFGQVLDDGRIARLTVVTQLEPLVDQAWRTVLIQSRISALNIATILILLTWLLRANARMLRRLATATDAFRRGNLDARMPEGGTIEARAMARTFNDMARKVQSLVLSLRDIQRVQSDQLHFQRQLIDALPLPLFVRGADGRLVETNQAWRALLAAQPGRASALPAWVPPAGTPAHTDEAREIQVPIAGRPPRSMAYYAAPFTTPAGTLAGTISTLVDVSERNQAQDALRAEKERAEITLASIGDGVIATDDQDFIESINEAAQLMTGYSAEHAIGRPLQAVFTVLAEAPVHGPGVWHDDPPPGGAVQAASRRILQHRSGERYPIEFTASAIRLADGTSSGRVLVFRDVTEAHQLRHQISWRARHDPLTGLYNRTTLAEQLTHALFQARQHQTQLAVCLLDLDHFQAINDTHRLRTGDRLLKEVGLRLSALAQPADTAARLGGDEFALLMGGLTSLADLKARVAQVMHQIAQPYAIDDVMLHITVSVGISVFPQDDSNPDTLLRHADQAMVQAKALGRGRMLVFDVERDHAVHTLHARQTRVAQALHAGELVLHYQPKVHLKTGALLGLEALLRWQHPERGLLGPADILPAIADAELHTELGEWVIGQALQQMRHWSQRGCGSWPVSVNIAATHFHQPQFVSRLHDVLRACPEVVAGQLELEILESSALGDLAAMRSLMEQCQALGVRFALDDFGTGYSSLAYLQQLPAETVKIDQSFIRDMLSDAGDRALVEAIIGLARAFDRQVVAEGVENAAQSELLLALGCERGQGFGLAAPMDAEAVVAWVRARVPSPAEASTPPLPAPRTAASRSAAV